MKNEWLTTLLKQKGLRLNAVDLTSLLEEISPKVRNGALGYILDWFQPYSAGLGLRVARLGDQHIEVILPLKDRNTLGSKESEATPFVHEGAVYVAATEALRLLWERHAPFGEFSVFAKKSQLDFRMRPQSELRIRWELLEAHREAMLSHLRQHRVAQGEAAISIFSDKDQLVGELNLNYEIFHTPSLESKK